MRNLILLILASAIMLSCRSKAVEPPIVKNMEKEINYIPYYLKMYEADSLYLVNDFARSYAVLDSLFKVYKPLNSDNYVEYGIYLHSALMSNHLIDLDKKVRYGFLHFGGIVTFHKNSYEMYDSLIKTTHIKKEEIVELKKQYYNSLNLNLRNRILKMGEEDQKVRTDGSDHTKMLLVDEANLQALDEIFEKFGLPTKELIGSNNAYDIADDKTYNLALFFLHQPENIKEKYLPKLLEGVKKGIIEPDVYTSVYDRMLLDMSKKQYYGTYYCSEDKLCDLIEPLKIDSIRKSKGLPHIDYYPWRVEKFRHAD